MTATAREFVVEVRLDPEGLSCDAVEAFVGCLAVAVGRIPLEKWRRAEASATWRERAFELIRAGNPPLPPGFAPAEQVANLAGSIGPDRLEVLVATPMEPDHLRRAIQWFERHSGLRVARLPDERAAPPAEVTEQVLAHREGAAPGWRYSVDALEGHPHPRSEGEQRLHRRLREEGGLQTQFECNQSVVTRHGRHYRVDFLHPALRIAVEVDGYHHHSSRNAFFSDRHRDYELLVSGYLTLRIDHAEVLRDIESVVGKIRDVVELRASQPEFA